MDLDEISSGTQRQIMLALRLALSQELVNSAVLGSQFVFLDEPFAFFDDERTRTSLKVLPQISDEISQVWIVSQEFPPDASFDRHVRCARDLDRLQAAG
jgi:exonuclease SbcC